MPKSVYSRGYSQYSGSIDHLTTHFIYDTIPHVVAEGGWAFAQGFGFSMRYTVNFEHATADFDLARERPLMLTRNGKTEAVDAGAGYGYIGELRYFIDCVKRHQPPAIVTADDAVRSLKIIEAEVQSAQAGQAVRL
jgi:predicted dehydrogenase